MSTTTTRKRRVPVKDEKGEDRSEDVRVSEKETSDKVAMPSKTKEGQEEQEDTTFDIIWFHTQSVLWVSLSAAAFYYGNVHNVFMSDRVSTFFWWVTVLGAALFSSSISFLLIVAPFIQKRSLVPDDWDVLYPRAIPTATIGLSAAVLGGILAIWSVYSFLSIAIVASLVMGGATIVYYIPAF